MECISKIDFIKTPILSCYRLALISQDFPKENFKET